MTTIAPTKFPRSAKRHALLVGERMNAARWRPWRDESPERGYALRLRLGCFRTGAGRERLLSMGLQWHAGINLLWPSPRLGEWDAGEARAAADMLLPFVVADFTAVVMLGRRVAAAFRRAGLEACDMQYDVRKSTGTRVGPLWVAFPHPSGRSRWWNEPDAERHARTCARRVNYLIERPQGGPP